MKTPLHIAPTPERKLQIYDAEKRVICTLDWQDLALAQRIVRRENGWWHTWFGERSDAAQRAYDRWVWERSRGHRGQFRPVGDKDFDPLKIPKVPLGGSAGYKPPTRVIVEHRYPK